MKTTVDKKHNNDSTYNSDNQNVLNDEFDFFFENVFDMNFSDENPNDSETKTAKNEIKKK